MDEASVAAAAERAQVMAPAYAFNQAQAALRIRKEVDRIALDESEGCTPELRDVLARVKELGRPLVIDAAGGGGGEEHCGEEEASACRGGEHLRLATVGLALLGLPELFVAWPGDAREAAMGVLMDLAIQACSGEADALARGRKVFAARFGVGYQLVEAPSVAGSPLYEPLVALTQSLRLGRPGPPPAALRLALQVDVRDGVLLGGFEGAVAVYARRGGGKREFTGCVQYPFPSPAWQEVGQDISVARLVDETGPLSGTARVISPEAFHEMMRAFD